MTLEFSTALVETFSKLLGFGFESDQQQVWMITGVLWK